jgi:two-component system, response regulator
MRSRSIVFAEDNPDHAYLIRRCLEPLGVQLLHAGDGEAALELMQSWTGLPPAFVLLDVSLPRLDGIEVLRRLRESEALSGLDLRVPVVIFSTSRLAADRERAYAAGANSYVAKPASFAEFRVVLERIGRYWTDLNVVSLEPLVLPVTRSCR